MEALKNSVCCCSATQASPTLCNPMDWSTTRLPVLHYLPQFAQTHVHWVDDVIQPSHPRSHPSPPALQSFPASGSLLQWVGSSHQVAKVLELQLQHQSSQWIFRVDLLRIDWLDLLDVQGDSQESSPTPQFKSISSLVLSLLYGPTLTSIHDYW